MNSRKHTKICIDGVDGSGKTTIHSLLRKAYPNLEIQDRGMLTRLTDVYPDDHPKTLDNDTLYIVLDADVEICHNRILARNAKSKSEGKEIKTDKYDEPVLLFKYKNRFVRLAIEYQIPYVDTSNQLINETFNHVINIIENNHTEYILPNPDLIDASKLPILIEGCSKIVRALNDEYNIIEYKPTVYSHKKQREGEVPGTDIERMQMTRNIIFLLEQNMIPHAYVYVGKKYVLSKKLDLERDIPNIEVVVKRCYIGSDAHRYYAMKDMKTRWGTSLIGDRNRYPQPIVRFDWRNPNRHPENGTPMGDETISDMLANYLIDVEKAKDLAIRTFDTLKEHFDKFNIFFEDVCFMITTDGKMHWSEISQDCGRYKLKNDDSYSALDKDVWRAGGTSELVLDKWHQMTSLVHEYTKNNY